MAELTELEVLKLYKGKKYAEMSETLCAWQMSAPSDFKPYSAYLKIFIDFFGAPQALFSGEKDKGFSELLQGVDKVSSPDKAFSENFVKLKNLAPVFEYDKFRRENLEFLEGFEKLKGDYAANPFERVRLLYKNCKADYEFSYSLIDRIEEVIGLPLDEATKEAINFAFKTDFDVKSGKEGGRKLSNIILNKKLDCEIAKIEEIGEVLFKLDPAAETYLNVLKTIKICEEKYLKSFIVSKKFGKNPKDVLIGSQDKLVRLTSDLQGYEKSLADSKDGLAMMEGVPVKKGLFAGRANKSRQVLIDMYSGNIIDFTRKIQTCKSDIQKCNEEIAALENAIEATSPENEAEKEYLKLLNNLWDGMAAKKSLLEEYGAVERTPDDYALYQKRIEVQILKQYGKTVEGYNKLNAVYASHAGAGGLSDYYLNRSSIAKLSAQLNEARSDLKELKNYFEL